MIKASISLQVLPKAENDKKMIRIIDRVIQMIAKSKVFYVVGPMETTMEGDLDVLLEVVKKAQYLCIQSGASQVFSNVKIMYAPKGILSITEKIKKYG